MKLSKSTVLDEILDGTDFSKSLVHVTNSPQSMEWTDDLRNIILSLLSYARTSQYWMAEDLYNDAEPIVHADVAENKDLASWEFIEGSSGTQCAKSTLDQLKIGNHVLTKDMCFKWKQTVLDNLKTSNPTTESELATSDYTISYLAYLALNLLRLATKDPAATASHIIVTTDARIKNFFGNRDNQGMHDVFLECHPPPTYQCLMFFQMNFSKNSTLFKSVIWGVIHSFISGDDSFYKGIFKATCMLSLSYTGLSFDSQLVPKSLL